MSIRGLSKVPTREVAGLQKDIESIGKQLQERRKELGFTQESFAEQMNVSVNSIKYIEQGRRVPSIAMLLRLSKVLKLRFTLEPR